MTGGPVEGAAASAANGATCPHCGAALEPGARFCEACGQSLAAEGASSPAGVAPAPAVDPRDDLSPISAPTYRPTEGPGPDPAGRPSDVAEPRPPCRECGGAVDADGYCTQCGTKAPSLRDHFEEHPAAWVAGVCDRGIRHARNEDAMALAVEGTRAALVVCDGVSHAQDSDVASLAAAKAVLDVLRAPLPKGMGVPQSELAAVTAVFTEAAAAGNRAVLATAPDAEVNPPSCTLVAAVLEDGVVHHCGIGDSRVYLLPDAGDGQALTVDDSMAQVLIAGGMARAEAESSPQAHSITQWLGKDSPSVVPQVGRVEVTGPGWLVACSDGLWNYASEPSALREQIRAAGSTDPMVVATHLVAFANAEGGQDNITVALARVGDPAALAPAAPYATMPTQDAPPADSGAASHEEGRVDG